MENNKHQIKTINPYYGIQPNKIIVDYSDSRYLDITSDAIINNANFLINAVVHKISGTYGFHRINKTYGGYDD